MGRVVWIFVPFLFVVSSPVSGATYYVRAGASGNGSSWSSAYGALPSTLSRGGTYYIADGTYSAYTFDDPISGTQRITIKKATQADHGTGTGWSSSYGDGQAVFKGTWTFRSGYYSFEGQVGHGATWSPGYKPYGIKLDLTGAGSGAKCIRSPYDVGSANVHGLEFRHIEATFGLSGSTTKTGLDVVYAAGGLKNNWVFSHCWLHDAGRTIFLVDGSWNAWVVEYCFINNNGWASSTGEHSEIASLRGSNKSMKHVFRYLTVKDYVSTGGFIFNAGSGVEFYGNVFFWTKDWGPTSNHGAIGAWGSNESPSVSKFKIYNNTFYDLTTASTSGGPAALFRAAAGSSGHLVYNNLWVRSKLNATEGSPFGNGIAAHDYNAFLSSGKNAPYGEAHGQLLGANPLADPEKADFRLKAPTARGLSLSSPYNRDPAGAVRGADGCWDRGAYEYGGGAAAALPVAVDDIASTQQSVPVRIDVIANDTGWNAAAVGVVLGTPPANGAAALDGDVVVYTSATGFSGYDRFTYTLSDGSEVSAPATVTVRVAAAADPALVFIDSFDGSASETIGNGWTEYEATGARVVIQDNRLFFADTSDVEKRPMVVHSFPEVATGTLFLSFDFNWSRDATEGAYHVYVQLGDVASFSPNARDTGAAVNLIWGNINGVHNQLGYRKSGVETSLAAVRGFAAIALEIDLDARTYAVRVDGTPVGASIPFDQTKPINAIRLYADALDETYFSGRWFDAIELAR